MNKHIVKYESKSLSRSTYAGEFAMLQKDIEAAIDSYTRKIYEPDSKFSDMIRMSITLVTNPNEMLGKIFNPKYSLHNDYPVLFGDSNFKRMKKIVSMDNISTNIEHFLTQHEIKKLRA